MRACAIAADDDVIAARLIIGLTAQQARDLIADVGNDREKLDAAAGKLNGERGKA